MTSCARAWRNADLVSRASAARAGASSVRSDLLSRPSRASALARAEREPGPSARIAKRNMIRVAIRRVAPGSRVSLRSPGTRERCARFVSRCQAVSPPRSRGAFLRPGWSLSLRVHPKRGVGGAPTGALALLSRLRDATDPHPAGRGASHDAGRSPLGAPPWRFWAGGRASISGIASGSVQRAPRSQVVMPGGRCPGPPESAVTSRGRRTPLPAPPSGSSLEDGPSRARMRNSYHSFVP